MYESMASLHMDFGNLQFPCWNGIAWEWNCFLARHKIVNAEELYDLTEWMDGQVPLIFVILCPI